MNSLPKLSLKNLPYEYNCGDGKSLLIYDASNNSIKKMSPIKLGDNNNYIQLQESLALIKGNFAIKSDSRVKISKIGPTIGETALSIENKTITASSIYDDEFDTFWKYIYYINPNLYVPNNLNYCRVPTNNSVSVTVNYQIILPRASPYSGNYQVTIGNKTVNVYYYIGLFVGYLTNSTQALYSDSDFAYYNSNRLGFCLQISHNGNTDSEVHQARDETKNYIITEILPSATFNQAFTQDFFFCDQEFYMSNERIKVCNNTVIFNKTWHGLLGG